MNRIIIDHLKRWGWLWLLLALANGFCTGAFLNEKQSFTAITFQIVLWLGAMQLNFDLGRGTGRVMSALPLTARELGRAWWIFSVPLPALVLAATSALALMIDCVVRSRPFPLTNFFTYSFANTVFLGMLYFFIVGTLPVRPQNFLGWLRYLIFIGFLMGMVFVRPSFETPKEIFILVMGSIFTIASWFQSEETVLRRATFRSGIAAARRTTSQHKSPSGFGGLPFLWQTLFIRVGCMGITAALGLLAIQLATHGTSKLTLRQLLEAALPALSSFGFFFLFIFLLLPLLMHLRHLRSLPVSSGAIAATLVLMPSAPIFLMGLAQVIYNVSFPEGGNVFHISANFFTGAAMMAVAAPIFVWQGLRMGSYFLIIFLLTMTSTGLMIFHPTKIPDWVLALASTGVIAVAWEWTRRLLKSSDKAYRIAPNMTPTGGGGWR